MTRAAAPIPLSTGIYYPAEAARLLRVPAVKLQRWARGYTFWRDPTHKRRGASGPVITSDLPKIGRLHALSFIELMEIRIVGKMRTRGLSLQYIRAAGRLGMRVLGTPHPFAHRRTYTDGRRIFMGLAMGAAGREDDPDLIELTRNREHQVILGSVFSHSLEEIDFDPGSELTARWWPMGRSVPVILDPRIAFGAPVVEGTRTQTYVVAGLAASSSAKEAAEAYGVSLGQVAAAVHFEAQLRPAA